MAGQAAGKAISKVFIYIILTFENKDCVKVRIEIRKLIYTFTLKITHYEKITKRTQICKAARL